MSPTTRAWLIAAGLTVLLPAGQLIPASAQADDQVLQNITYRARIDGLARGAQISYLAQDDQMQTADPTMLPGRTFEANAVLQSSQQPRMQVSIQWPYSANLHCEIIVNGAPVAQADDFIAPRLTRASSDPNYGVLTCEAPASGLSQPDTPGTADTPSTADTATPLPDAPHFPVGN